MCRFHPIKGRKNLSQSKQIESINIESPSGISIRVYRRGKKGTWWFAFNYRGNHRGTTQTKSLKHAKDEAIQKAEKLCAQRRLGLSEKECATAPLLNEFWSTYLEQHSKINKRPRTVQRDITSAKHLLPFFGTTRIDAVSKKMVAEFQAKRQKKVGNREINIETNLLKAILNKAVDWEIIPSNPLQRLKKLPENPGRTRYLFDEEWNLLRSKLQELEITGPAYSVTARLRRYTSISIGTMMRPCELISLKWSDTDFKLQQITVQDSKNRTSRVVPMSPAVYECLQQLRLIQTSKWPTCDYVFPNSHGCKASMYTFSLPFRKLVKKIGLKDFRRYDLRHTGASWAAQVYKDVFALQEVMGHKSLSMTRRYSHLSDRQKRDVVNAIDNRLSTHLAPADRLEVA